VLPFSDAEHLLFTTGRRTTHWCITRPETSGPDSHTRCLNTDASTVDNLGKVNARYEPWVEIIGQELECSKVCLTGKRPLVRRSDDWDFPTNKFPNVGWLGRVHRGTPGRHYT